MWARFLRGPTEPAMQAFRPFQRALALVAVVLQWPLLRSPAAPIEDLRLQQALFLASHLLLLAENMTGYRNPLKLASAAQLEEIPKIVKEIIEKHNDVRFDRGHFATYGDFSLNFEFVYFVIGSEYLKYMDIQLSINMKIYREFENRGIEFAYPTQTLFLNKENEITK